MNDDDLSKSVQPNSDGAFVYTYNIVHESGYAINATLVLRQQVLCQYFENPDPTPHLGDCKTIDLNIPINFPVFYYGDDPNNPIPVTNNLSVKYNTTIKVNESGTYTFILKCDDSCTMRFNDSLKIDLTSDIERGEFSDRFTVDLTINTYYPAYIEFTKYTGNSLLQLYWIKPGQNSEEIVPEDNLWFDHFYGGQRIDFNITCTPGYSTSYVDNELFWHKTWGDGLRIEDEQWDDLNTNNGDGCSSKCTVEKGYICSGGNAILSDKWVRCPVGYKNHKYFENTDYTECIPETDDYDTIFYMTIMFLGIGMIKYFLKDFMRVYILDKHNRFARGNIHEIYQEENQNMLLRPANHNMSEDHDDQARFERQINQNSIERHSNKNRLEGQEDRISNITDEDEYEESKNHIEFHR